FFGLLARLTGENAKIGHMRGRGKGPCKPQRHVVKLLFLWALSGDDRADGGAPCPWYVRCCAFGSDRGIHYKNACRAPRLRGMLPAKCKLRREHRRGSERVRQLHRRETSCYGLSRSRKPQSRSP